MNKINLYQLCIEKNANVFKQWDFEMLNDLFMGRLWKPPSWVDIQMHKVDTLPEENAAIVVLSARMHAGMEPIINNELAKINKVILFLVGDEEADYNIEELKHDNITIWVQNAHPGIHDNYYKIPTGYTPQSRKYAKYEQKKYELFFSGQILKKRRFYFMRIIKKLYKSNWHLNFTPKFGAGYEHQKYFDYMNKAKIVPAPGGNVMPDTFRLFEAIECLAVPIAEQTGYNEILQKGMTKYWDWIFESAPFPKIDEWTELNDALKEINNNYPQILHETVCWWIEYKRKLAYTLTEQVNAIL